MMLCDDKQITIERDIDRVIVELERQRLALGIIERGAFDDQLPVLIECEMELTKVMRKLKELIQ